MCLVVLQTPIVLIKQVSTHTRQTTDSLHPTINDLQNTKAKLQTELMRRRRY
jgi:hypothetical protein